jgi:hypothetical protein
MRWPPTYNKDRDVSYADVTGAVSNDDLLIAAAEVWQTQTLVEAFEHRSTGQRLLHPLPNFDALLLS